MRTSVAVHVCAVVAVVGVVGGVDERRKFVRVRAALVGRSIQSDIDIEASIHRHYAPQPPAPVLRLLTQA